MGHLNDHSLVGKDVSVALSVQNLSVQYAKTKALSGLTFELPRASCCAIVGPNGAGKSTLFKCILNLVKASEGQVKVFGSLYNPRLQKLAYIPQRSQVDWEFPATVIDLVMMAIDKQSFFAFRNHSHIREQALGYLKCVGLESICDKQLRVLSGGQQQRVFFARALAQRAELYLMDEPFTGVDADTEGCLIQTLRDLCGLGKTVMVIHHNIYNAPEIFSHALMLNKSLVAFGAMDQVWSKSNIKKTFTAF
jgi:manganese/zinc/iron transport system ATP- binding protein